MNNPAPPRHAAASAAIVLAMLLLTGLITAASAYLALEWMPCSWFGSSFEGACGYGAVWTTAAVALLVWPLLFVCSVLLYFRRGGRTAAVVDGVAAAPAGALMTQWRVVFALAMLVNLLPFLLLFGASGISSSLDRLWWWLGMLLLLLNAVVAYRVAARMGQRPVVMAVLSLVSWIGAAGVFIYLHSLRRRAG